jgi:hypothetical protein
MLDCLLDFGLRGHKCRSGDLLKPNHAAEADGQVPDHLQERDKLAVRDAIATVEQRDERDHTRAKGAGRDVRRALCRDQVATAGAAQRVELILSDQRLDLRQFPDLVELGQNHRAQAFGDWLVTLGAAAWANGDDLVNLIFGEQRALVGRVASLSALGLISSGRTCSAIARVCLKAAHPSTQF